RAAAVEGIWQHRSGTRRFGGSIGRRGGPRRREAREGTSLPIRIKSIPARRCAQIASRRCARYNTHLTAMKKLLLALALCCACAFADTQLAVAIRNAKIVTVSGPVIAKGTVVVRNGLIEAVGENVTVPADAWVVEGEGLTV